MEPIKACANCQLAIGTLEPVCGVREQVVCRECNLIANNKSYTPPPEELFAILGIIC